MKHFMVFFLILVLITSCRNNDYGTSDKRCKRGICLSYDIDEQVESLKPLKITVIISSDSKLEKVKLSILNYSGIIFTDIKPLNGVIEIDKFSDSEYSAWITDINSGEEYIINAYIEFPSPSQLRPVSYYHFEIGVVTYPGGSFIGLAPSFILDSDGKAITQAEAEKLEKVPIYFTRVPGGIIIEGTLSTFVPTRTPSPEKTQELKLDLVTGTPTITPTATITPTQPAYPGP
jgi:hypothetical protein